MVGGMIICHLENSYTNSSNGHIYSRCNHWRMFVRRYEEGEPKEPGPISKALGKALYISIIVVTIALAVHFLPYREFQIIEEFVLKVIDKIHP